jgi:hypothetical protein
LDPDDTSADRDPKEDTPRLDRPTPPTSPIGLQQDAAAVLLDVQPIEHDRERIVLDIVGKYAGEMLQIRLTHRLQRDISYLEPERQ